MPPVGSHGSIMGSMKLGSTKKTASTKNASGRASDIMEDASASAEPEEEEDEPAEISSRLSRAYTGLL